MKDSKLDKIIFKAKLQKKKKLELESFLRQDSLLSY